LAKALEILDSLPAQLPREEAVAVFHPQPKDERIRVTKEGDIFVVSAPRVDKLLARMDIKNPEARSYVRRQLERMGVSAALKRAGAKPGDVVRFGKVELEWE